MLKMKFQYYGQLIWRANSLEKTVMLGKIEGRRRGDRGSDGWMALLTQWTWVWVNSRSWWWIARPAVMQSMRSQRVGHDWATEKNLTRLVITFLPRSKCLLISLLQSPSALILEPPKIRSVTVSTVSPSICLEVIQDFDASVQKQVQAPWSSVFTALLILSPFLSPGVPLSRCLSPLTS